MRSLRLILLLVCAAAASAAPRAIPIPDAALITDHSSNPGPFLRAGSLLFFTAVDDESGRELWRTDGTTAGTTLVQDIRPGTASSNPTLGAAVGSTFIFVADDGTGPAIWRTNGAAAGTTRLDALARGGQSAVRIVGAGSRVFVIESTGLVSADIWVTDGTVAGTRLTGTFPIIMFDRTTVGANGLLFFAGTTSDVGAQLWVSDGTAVGTHVARRGAECAGSSCGPAAKMVYPLGNGVLAVTESELWRSDGTAAGTSLLGTLPQLGGAVMTNDRVAYVVTAENAIWRTDGTTAGTTKTVLSATGIASFRVLDDNRLVWVARRGPQMEIWVSDGTTAGTRLVGTTRAALVNGVDPIVAVSGSKVYLALADRTDFAAPIHGDELWLEDVQAESLAFIADVDDRLFVNGPADGTPATGTPLGSQIVFRATNLRGTEPWITDGTTAGTRILRNINGEGPAGAVSGTVRDAATGAPIAGQTVQLCTTSCDDALLTDAAGHYRFDPVRPQTVTVQTGGRGYVLQRYGNGAQLSIADGTELTGVDFDLVRGGTITGRVTHVQSGAPVANAQMVLVSSSGANVALTGTDSSGQYRFQALSTGTYYVATAQFFSTVIGQIYKNHDCAESCGNATTGDPVPVTIGAETAGIDFFLHDFGRISGTIRDASTGTPVAKATVTFSIDGSNSSSAPSVTADDQGRYLSPFLSPRTYFVTAGAINFTTVRYPAVACPNPSACAPGAGTPVTVQAGGTTQGIDIGLAPSQARLTGTLRGSDGEPIVNEFVSLRDSMGFFVGSVGEAQTDPRGRFVFPVVPPGTYYLKAAGELYGGVDCTSLLCSIAAATPLVLTAGRTTTVDMKSRARYFHITGRLLDARTGHLIGNDVRVSGQPSGGVSPVTGGVAFGNGATYDLTVVARATSVQLSASARGYHTKTNAGTFTRSADGVDILLDPFGTITGTVYSARTGQPLASVNVQFLLADGKTSAISTDRDGHYVFVDANGTCRAWIGANGPYGGQVYRERDCGTAACVPATGDPIIAPDGVTASGIDFHLQTVRPSVIQFSGRVVDDETGAPMAGVNVSSTGSYSVSTDADGRYVLTGDSIHDLTPGDYRLVALAGSPYYAAWSGGGYCVPDFMPCAAAGPAMTVAAGTSPVVNFRMVRMHLLGVAPAAGPIAGGTRVVLTGDRFPASPEVRFNGTLATVVSSTATQIIAITPAAESAGAAHVKVSDPRTGPSITRLHAFLYGGEAPAPLPAATLAVVAPAAVRTNVPFDVTVTALDGVNDLASGYRGTVTITSSAVGSLPAPYTFTADDSGRHTFTVTLTSFGAQTLTINDGTRTTERAIAVSCADATASATVVPLPVPPAFLCGGSAGNVASITAVPGSAYAWSVANGRITAGQGTNAITYTAGAIGDVTLTLAMSNASSACSVTTYAATVPIRVQPVASIPPFVEGCSGMPLTVPIMLTGTAPFHLVWSDGVEQNGLPATGASRTLTAPVTGPLGIVSVDDASCSSAAGATATVLVNSAPQVVSASTDVSVRAGDPVRFIAAPEPHATLVVYRWYQGEAGDESHPVGADGPWFDTPPVQSTLRYWVRATNNCGSTVRQFTARVAVAPGRRRAGS